MCTCSALLKIIALQLVFLFLNAFMIDFEGRNKFLSKIDKNDCPFIETLSFGSDISIKCNNSYLIFNEINADLLHWKFANQTLICNQDGIQQASVNQCGISRINSNFLKVELQSSVHNEKACVYCRMNYKPIAPLISVNQSDDGQHILYRFNITATGLTQNESFEILWAKRVGDEIRYSFNYWFSQKCVDSIVEILENNGHTIIFLVDDVAIDRVEFIIRRCNGTCRNYVKCDEHNFQQEINSNHFRTPDSIEKISCNSTCLYGIITASIPTITTFPSIKPLNTLSVTKTPSSDPENNMKILYSLIGIGLLLIIILIICIIYIHIKRKDHKQVYTKTNHVDPDEHK